MTVLPPRTKHDRTLA